MPSVVKPSSAAMPSPDAGAGAAAARGRRGDGTAPPAAAGASPLPNAIVPKIGSAAAPPRSAAGDDLERPLAVGGRRRVAEVRVARLVAQMRTGPSSLPAGDAGRDRQLHADRERLLEDGERLIAVLSASDRSTAGRRFPSTVTPAGASIVSSVGISSGSRGLFDWVCRPSGSDTCSATRDVVAGVRRRARRAA